MQGTQIPKFCEVRKPRGRVRTMAEARLPSEPPSGPSEEPAAAPPAPAPPPAAVEPLPPPPPPQQQPDPAAQPPQPSAQPPQPWWSPPPPVLRKQVTLSVFASGQDQASRRKYVLGAFILVSLLQGGTFATFSMLPKVTVALFPAVTLASLSWTLNSNNLAQAIFIPVAIWILRAPAPSPGAPPSRTGLRAIVVIASAAQAMQSMLWVMAAYLHDHHNIRIALQFGAGCGGVCTACLQGSCSRLSAVWFPSHLRGFANALAFSALFGAQVRRSDEH